METGHDPDVVRAYGLGPLPDALNGPRRLEVKRLSGNSWVPTLVLDDGEVVDGSDQIAAWARAHRAGRLGRKTARGLYDYDGGVEAVAPGAAGSIPSARCRSSAPGPGIARTLPGDSRWWQCEQVSSGEVSWSQSRCHQLRGGPSSPGAWASPHAVSAMSTGPRS